MSLRFHDPDRKPGISLLSAALVAAGALGLFSPVPAAGWTVSGLVRNSSGTGIAGVDLDFEDRNTGTIIFTPNDDSDLSGHYATSVPAGDYRILVNPPLNSSYFPDQRDIVITSDTVADFTLAGGVFVSGYVRDEGGTGLLNVDLNFYDSATGENLGYSNDNTDASGFYSLLVDPDRTFDILYRPSPGDPHVAWTAENVTVGLSSVTLPPVVLDSGFFVSGLVTIEGTGNPVQGADIDARSTVTGETLSRLGFDNTDASGGYQVVLKSGTWDIVVSPPSGSGLAGDVEAGVVVAGDTFVGTVTLPPGFSVSGTVTDGGGAPLANVNVDAVDLSRGVEIPTSGDHTNTAGQYAILLGAGVYDLIFWPPPGAPLAAAVVRDRSISASTSLPPVPLLPGFVVSGTVRTATGMAVLGSDIDAQEISTGRDHPTAGDNSGGGGAYSIRVPGGSYRLIANPPPGSGLLPDTLVTTVSSNRTIDFSLPFGGTTGVSEDHVIARPGLSIGPVYPNPVRNEAHVDFHLPIGGSGRAVVTIVSATGRRVRTLLDAPTAGRNLRLAWDGRDDSGRQVANGVYFVRIAFDGSTAAARLTLAR